MTADGSRPTLCVVMIVKNEAGCLDDCLQSAAEVADELVVGDTGSTDETKAVAREHSARIIDVPWRDDFAEARNRVLTEATGDWLLHLDADETLDAGGAARIRAIVDADGRGADAIEVTLANYCDDPRSWRWVPVDPDDPYARGASGYIAAPLLRLFRNGRGFEYREAVHENITESVVERGGVIRAEPIVIHHHGYRQAKTRKGDFYLKLGRKKVAQRPHDPKAWHDMAEQLLACGHADEAEEACRKALALDPSHLGGATALANLLLNRGDLDEARVLLERFEAAGTAPPHVMTALGAIACRQGRLDEARARLEAVVTAVPGNVMAHLCLGRVWDQLGSSAAARRCIEQAAAAAPRLAEAGQRLEALDLRLEGERLFEQGDVQGGLEALVAALCLDPEDPVMHNDIGVVQAALGKPGDARASFGRALQLAPEWAQLKENLRACGG